MAVSNRDRVGRAFELLAAGLGPYVDRRMGAGPGAGTDWLAAFASSARPPIPGPASLTDPALQLRVMADAWDTSFRAELTRADRNIVFELRDVRNRWAHNDAFTVDDAYRALDSIERLLVSVDASEAIDVGRSKEDLMRLRFEAQARKAVPTAEVLVSEPAAGLKPWRDVIQPHDDVARGRFALAEFAADLHQVAQGPSGHLDAGHDEGASEYTDPVAFFERTFLTEGLRRLLTEAVSRVAGDSGSPIVDLQTSFGGGKTHSMIALYHLLSGTPLDRFPQEVQDLVRATGATAVPSVRRAVLVGTELRPGQESVKPDGTKVGTLWGELAWQLGGADGFALVAEADRTRTNPGGALRDLFRQFSPCLVLIDEWVAYARGLYADDSLRGGTFDTHFTFAQALTEAARSTPGTLLVVSIPASESPDGTPIGSEHEVGGAGGREALRRLRVVVGRMESSWRPATAEESFEIVRRRLFQPVDPTRLPDRDATARVFGELYRSQAGEFPPETRERAYEERIKQAYPIHPELFARLYEDWSTLERFQRTRGVLRLMATVVHALWAAGDQSPVILPATVPLSDATVVAELTRNLDDSWKPIIDADVDGPTSLPRSLDDEIKNLGRYSAARRVARTVFLGSAPLAGTPNQGLDAARVRLGCALPGETVAIYADALNRLADRGTYFFVGGGRYWYGTQAGITRVARDRAQRLLAGNRHEVRDEIVELLGKPATLGSIDPFTAVHPAPASPAEVADVASARLVILRPDAAHVARSEESVALSEATSILDSRGTGPREHRNMVVFLAADQRSVDDLEQAVADAQAWRSVERDAGPLGLDAHQQAQAQERREDAERTVGLRLAASYQWLLVPRQPESTGPIEWEVTKADGAGGLAARAAERLRFNGLLYQRYPHELLHAQLAGPLAPLWEKTGHVTVDEVWSAYSRYLYLDRLKDAATLCATAEVAPNSTSWATEGVAVAESFDATTGRYVGLVAGAMAEAVRGSTLLVRADLAEAQQTADAIELRERSAADGGNEGTSRANEGQEHSGGELVAGGLEPATARRFYATIVVDAARLPMEAARINTEVLAHLNALDGTEMEITIEVRATRKEGFPDETVRLVGENATALRFRDHGFESS